MIFLSQFLFRLTILFVAYETAILIINPHQAGSLHSTSGLLVEERWPKAQLLKTFAARGPVEGLILGSSRGLSLSPKLLGKATGLRYFNFAVSGSQISDISAIYADVVHAGLHPRRILLSLDVNALMTRQKVEQRRQLIAAGSKTARITQAAFSLKSTVNAAYADDLVRSAAFEIGLLKPKPQNVFDEDGGLAWRWVRPPDTEYNRNLGTCVDGMHSQIARYDVPSTIQFDALHQILRLAADESATVDIFLSPFNPHVAAQMFEGTGYNSLRTRVLTRLSQELRAVNANFYDIGDVSRFHSETRGWMDCVHYGPDIGDQIVRVIFP